MKKTCKTCIWGDQCHIDWSKEHCDDWSPVDEETLYAEEVRKTQIGDMDYYHGQLNKDKGVTTY